MFGSEYSAYYFDTSINFEITLIIILKPKCNMREEWLVFYKLCVICLKSLFIKNDYYSNNTRNVNNKTGYETGYETGHLVKSMSKFY